MLRRSTLRYFTVRTLPYAALRHVTLRYATLRLTAVRDAAVCNATPRYSTLKGGSEKREVRRGGLIPSATAVRACHRPIDRKSIDLRLEGARTNSSRGHSPPRPAPACHPQLHPLWPPHSPFSESPRYWYTGPPPGPGHPRALSTSPRHQYTRLREPAPRAHPPPARPWPAAPPPGPSLWGACITGAPAGRPPGPPWARPLSESSHHRYT